MDFNKNRYQDMHYNYCGNSGLKLPEISLGLWQNFGTNCDLDNAKDILKTAFDNGITHFDLANNYGPLPGSAEENFGRILHTTFSGYRDELVISTKAGYTMWDGPYGDWGSKKYLVSSLDQSLKRMDLDYVDIFYHHRPDPNTPLEETAHTLDLLVKQGKALYVGISNYKEAETIKMYKLLKEMGTPFVIHQARYNLLDRHIEEGDPSLLDILGENGIGCIAFSPLCQGILTNRYFDGVPLNSRKAKSETMGKVYNETNLNKALSLNVIAQNRGQSLSQMSISWILNNPNITSVLMGVSSKEQLLHNLESRNYMDFESEELSEIDEITIDDNL